MAAHAVPGSGGSCSWEGMKRGGNSHFPSILSHPIVPIILGVPEPEDFFGPPTGAPPGQGCGKGLVIALDLPKLMAPSLVLITVRDKEPLPVSAEQEESRDVSSALGTVLDHLHVEAVIVNCIVRDDHCPPAMLLYHSGLGEEGAAPGRGDETNEKVGSSLPLY